MMASVLDGFAPASPNRTPRSSRRLNSRYLPLRILCHLFCSSVHGTSAFSCNIGEKLGRNSDSIRA